MTTSPENKPKLKLTPAERTLDVRLVSTAPEEENRATNEIGSSHLVRPAVTGSNSTSAVNNVAPAPPLAAPGQRFAQWYEIIEQTGADATTVAYKATDISTNSQVTLKVLLPYFIQKTASEQIVQHRLAQAQALAHESIVPVLAVGVNEDGQTYIVEEYQDGISLKQLMQNEPISPPTLVDIFTQVCDGLEYAHSRGVVHGSLNPDDIVLVPRPEGGYTAQIRNFAIDALIPTRDEDVQKLTGCGVILNPELAQYLSPEQCTGGKADARSDIFALGCIMYEALSGRKAVEAGTFVQALTRQLREMPPSFADFCFDKQISEAFEVVIFKCLDKRPDARYQKAGQLKLALMLPQMLTGKPKPRVNTTDPVKHVDHDTSHMRKIAWISGGVVALGLVIATVFVWLPNHTPMPDDPPALSSSNQTDNVPEKNNATNAGGGTDEASDYSSAIQERIKNLNKLLTANPNDVEALLARAQANYDANDFANAINDLNRRTKLHPDRLNGNADSRTAVKLKIECLLRSNKIDDANKAASALVQQSPKDALALTLHSNALMSAGHIEQAYSAALQATALGTHSADAMVARAAAENALGKYVLALASAQAAQQTDAKNLNAYGEAAKALVGLGRYEEAETQCMKVFDYTTELAPPYVWLGDCYFAQRKYDDAIYEYEQATGIDGDYVPAYIGSAKTYAKQARYEEAITDANKALAVDDKNGPAYELLASVYKIYDPSKVADVAAKAVKYSHRSQL